MPAIHKMILIDLPPSGAEGLEDEPQGEHGKEAVEKITRPQLGAQARDLAAEHVRHQVHNSDQANEPGHECANPPPHLAPPPCVFSSLKGRFQKRPGDHAVGGPIRPLVNLGMMHRRKALSLHVLHELADLIRWKR